MKPVVDQIRELVQDVPGWTPDDQLFALYMLVVSTSGLKGDVWEIGSWCGRSTTVLALAARQSDSPRVQSIDLFPNRSDWFENADGTFSFKVTVNGKTTYANSEQTVWREPYLRDIDSMYAEHGENLLEIFTGVMERKGFADIVRAFRGTPTDYAGTSDRPVRVGFIDGDHGYEAVSADIKAIEQFLVPGGWIAFDDAFGPWHGVNRAIEELIIGSGRYDCAQLLTRKLFAARRKG